MREIAQHVTNLCCFCSSWRFLVMNLNVYKRHPSSPIAECRCCPQWLKTLHLHSANTFIMHTEQWLSVREHFAWKNMRMGVGTVIRWLHSYHVRESNTYESIWPVLPPICILLCMNCSWLQELGGRGWGWVKHTVQEGTFTCANTRKPSSCWLKTSAGPALRSVLFLSVTPLPCLYLSPAHLLLPGVSCAVL
jgi:hypothetical protein